MELMITCSAGPVCEVEQGRSRRPTSVVAVTCSRIHLPAEATVESRERGGDLGEAEAWNSRCHRFDRPGPGPA